MLSAVPAFGNEWYGKWMYDPDHDIHAEHERRFGPVAQFGYKEFIPRFTAEHYRPAEWAELFERAGAQYGGFSLAHHDGFGLWDSDVYGWNVGKMGPRRDLYGELVAELRKRDLRVVAPFHIIRGFNWFLPGWNQWDRTYNEAAVERGRSEGWDIFDPEYADFYWNQFTGRFEDFLALWKAKVVEVIDRYRPDLMWFDGGRFRDGGFESEALEVLCHYFNRSEEWKKRVAVLNKLPVSMQFNFPDDFGVWNYEAGRDRPPVVARPWNDDMRIGDPSWAYVEDQSYISGREILHGLIDRVSRGGSLMLSISPRADGVIPQAQVDALQTVGSWLRVNGEAIYRTRPWVVHAEGNPQNLIHHTGEHHRWVFKGLDAKDRRYTRSANGEAVYAIALGWPADRVEFPALGSRPGHLGRPIRGVNLLGEDAAPGTASWIQEQEALVIRTARSRTGSFEDAAVWKIALG
jgi:alpha-L-fucosidase